MLAPNTLLKERYRILQNIGSGGFGYVYKAIDEVFGCSVAIKETREEVGNREKLRKAFEREAKLLRNLKHDSLPRVTDYFFHSEAQFLVMDFIEGEDFAALLNGRLRQHQEPFTCQELLPWTDKILSALEYLHSRPEPIIHRDIKPSNIKLADDGGVYLLDFGLARGVTGQMSTIIEGKTSSSVLGFTREYAPLEQLQDTTTEPQSDIYALSATLYHLLTAQLPVSAFRRDEALQRGQGDPLRPAHEVNPAIPLAVSQVISHGLALRWWDRIGSAQEMRAALTQACREVATPEPSLTPQSASEAALPGSKDKLSAFPLLQEHKQTLPDNAQAEPPAGTATVTYRSRRSWRTAVLALLLLISLAVAARLAFSYWFTPTISIKPAYQAAQPTENLKSLGVATPANLGLKLALNEHKGIVWSVAFSPDGRLAASASEEAIIILWDTKTWERKFTLKEHASAVYSIAFSPDGKTLASGSHDTTIKLWDTQTGRLIKTLPQEYTKPVLRLAFSPDGASLASFSGARKEGDKEIRLWDVRNGWSITLKGHDDAVTAIAFSPDGSILASTGYDNTLRLWNPKNGEQSVVLKVGQPLKTIAFSADGRYLACGSSDKTIKLWLYQPQTRSWEEQAPLEEHKDSITSIAFSPDNKTLVSASKDNTVRLWDVETGTSGLLSISQKSRIQGPQWSLAFSPDGQTLLTGGQDKMVLVWK